MNNDLKTQLSEKIKWISNVINEHPLLIDSIINEMLITDKLSKNAEICFILTIAVFNRTFTAGDS
jgi:hypothetical protein